MGRRSRLMCKETALRYRIERIGDRTKTATYKWANAQPPVVMLAAHKAISRFGRGKALTAWAIAQFKAKGYVPSKAEACQAIDDGTVGRWIDQQNPNKPDRVEYPDRPKGSRKPPEWKAIGDQIRAERAELEARFAESRKILKANLAIEDALANAMKQARQAK